VRAAQKPAAVPNTTTNSRTPSTNIGFSIGVRGTFLTWADSLVRERLRVAPKDADVMCDVGQMGGDSEPLG
jgi:hypothetical protein